MTKTLVSRRNTSVPTHAAAVILGILAAAGVAAAAGVQIPYLVLTIGISPADGLTTHVEKVDTNPQLDTGTFIKAVSK